MPAKNVATNQIKYKSATGLSQGPEGAFVSFVSKEFVTF